MRKKKPFLALNNTICENTKNRFVSKGLTHVFGKKMPVIWFI